MPKTAATVNQSGSYQKSFFSVKSLIKCLGSNLYNPTQKDVPLKNLRYACLALFLVHSFCTPVALQTPGITPQAPVGKGTIVLKAARLIDGTGAAAINNAVVLVTDNMIAAVGAAGSVNIPANAKVIDLGDVTLNVRRDAAMGGF